MRRFLFVFTASLIVSAGLSVPSVASASSLAGSAQARIFTVHGAQFGGFLAVDAHGNIYTDSGTTSLLKFSPKGKILARWDGLHVAADAPDGAAGIALDAQGNVYVVDTAANQIVKLSSTLQEVAQWGGYGTAPGKFIAPAGIALDNQGNIYVADTGNARVQKLSPEGSVLALWDDGGTFRDPNGITVDQNGAIYVADTEIDQIVKLSPSGQQLATYTGSTQTYLVDVAVDGRGRVYGADWGSRDVLVFSPSGRLLVGWSADQLNVYAPTGLARSPSGTLYASECPVDSSFASLCRVVKWSAKGKITTTWTSGAKPVAPGAMIDMGGYGLHIRCVGQGSPTVVFEAGFGGDSTEWSFIQPQLAAETRVCAYDRPGTGLSNSLPGSKIPGTLQVAQELHALLQKANVPAPYILAGHSMGGMFIRMFAEQYRSEVAGLVLIDSVNENQWSSPGIASAGEVLDLDLSIQQMHAATGNTIKGSLGALPLIALTQNADLPSCPDCFAPASRWDPLQAELASASSNSVHVMALRSGHGIPYNQPGLVIEAVREVLAAARGTDHTLPACGAAFQQLGGKCMS